MRKIKFSKKEQSKELINYIDGDWAEEIMHLVHNKETKKIRNMGK